MSTEWLKPDSDGVLRVDAPIVSVTVFEDRAQVSRKVSVRVEAGSWRLRIREVTPLLSDKSVQLKSSAPGLEVGDSNVLRWTRFHQDSATFRQLEEERLLAKDEEERCKHERWRIETRRSLHQQQLADFASRWKNGIPRGVDPTRSEKGIATLLASLREAKGELQAVAQEEGRVNRRLEALGQRVRLARERPGDRVAALEAQLLVKDAGDYELTLTYVTPCALWRPEHLARLKGKDAPSLTLETTAVVWQRTGEVWENVQLFCSTARPGRIAVPPSLVDDILRSRRKTEQEKKEIVAELRDQEIKTTGLGGTTESSEMPGLDDGGEALSLEVPGRVTVASSGLPVRLPLSKWTAAAKVSRVCFPELKPSGLIRAEVENPGPRPILAGPVSLYQESGYVGQTSTRFISPLERTAFSFGSQDDLRVHRTRNVTKEETRLTGYQTITVKIVLTLSNLSDRPAALEVAERIPVSEIEEVRVALADDAPAKADSEGRVIWTERLAPRGHATRTLVYKVEAPARVILPL